MNKQVRKMIKKTLIIVVILMMSYKIIEAMKSGDVHHATHGNIIMIFLMAALAKIRYQETIESADENVDPELIREFEEYEKGLAEAEKKESPTKDDSQAS